ncbi:hypothetical protein ACVWWO_005204 [Bradyrhizobium sp. F1.13.1]
MSEIDCMGPESFLVKVIPSNDREYNVDLSEFALGSRRGNRGTRYSGRPYFASEIVALFKTLNPPKAKAKEIRVALRQLFRYLERRAGSHPDEVVASCLDVKDAHGVELRTWLGGRGATYRRIKSTLDSLRWLNGYPPLFWASRRRDRLASDSALDEDAARRLYLALKNEARSIKAMFADGSSLASCGEDPRGRTHGWKSSANRAWMVEHLVENRVFDQEGLADRGAVRLVTQPGPSYLAPGMNERDLRSLVGSLRWCVPSRSDTGVFLWLFLLKTGWNLSTACGVDVLDPDGWYQPHPQVDLLVVIHAFKRRADRHQFAISMTRSPWHPYQIVRFMIERTKPLRDRVLADLIETRLRMTEDPNLDLRAQEERLETLSRTPWLFASRGSAGPVSGFTGNGRNRGLLEVARLAAKRGGLTEDSSKLFSVVTKDACHAWMRHAYVHSNYHVLITSFAGGHRSLQSTRHYIQSRRYRAHSEAEIRKVQNALFSEIASGRVVDPTRLGLLVECGKITPEQEHRLSDLRKRTRVGMGCLDPRAPPKQVDPDHPEGAICRVQRCTGCQHGVVFPESMPALARRFAELLQLKRTMPLASWIGCSLADEYESIEQTLAHFEAGRVSTEVGAWTAKLISGEVIVHGTYPSY